MDLGEDLETVCPKLAVVKFYTQISTINILKIRYNVLIQCHGNY